MNYVDGIQGIETHMMQRKTHRRGIDLSVVSERYYPRINRFVVVYEPVESNSDAAEKIRTFTIEKGFDKLSMESFIRANNKTIRKINQGYPELAVKLDESKKYELVETFWRECNFKEHSGLTGDTDELAIFYSEDANGISLVPMSQTTHENQITVVYYPLMDSKNVASRLILEQGYVENIDFDLL